MDTTSIVVLVASAMILSWYALQAWQLSKDTAHDHTNDTQPPHHQQ
jgi:hypothetical protein